VRASASKRGSGAHASSVEIRLDFFLWILSAEVSKVKRFGVELIKTAFQLQVLSAELSNILAKSDDFQVLGVLYLEEVVLKFQNNAMLFFNCLIE
jgi:hypothetical protein